MEPAGFMLFIARARAFLARIPWQLYAALGVVLVVILGVWWHGVLVGRALDKAYKEGEVASDAAWQVRFDEMKKAAESDREETE